MKTVKKVLLGVAVFILTAVVLIGPWPVYTQSNFAQSSYYKRSLVAIDQQAAQSRVSPNPGRLSAGWAMRIMTPNVGVPMGGYGGRPDGKRSKGVRDELMAKAIALSDGTDTAVILGADMLIIPPNIVELTAAKVGQVTPLTVNNIYFTATHTHCGPGGFAPGLAAKVSAGDYDPVVPEFLSKVFAEAIVEAYESMKPAQLAAGMLDASQFIRNRTRQADVDSTLNYMVVEQEGGKRCYVFRWSAHPTIFGQNMMEFSAEFPGEMMRQVEQTTNAVAIYLGGALGSMSPRAPDASSDCERVALYGKLLGKLLVDGTEELDFMNFMDVASLSATVGTPPIQARPVSSKWRLSPFVSKLVGIPREGRIQGLRIGDIMLVGLPFDVSGELSKEWREVYGRQGWDLWVTSFSGAYLGYLSPDRYYYETDEKGNLGYEIGFMNWLGPQSEAYFAALIERVFTVFGPPPMAKKSLSAGATL